MTCLVVQFTGSRKTDNQRAKAQGPQERTIGIENDGALSAAVAQAQSRIKILNGLYIPI